MIYTKSTREELNNLVGKIMDRLADSENKSSSDESPVKNIGLAVWDIFSNNNAVLDKNGEELDLGSWREAAGSIANAINAKCGESFDASSFFRGTEYVSEVPAADQLDRYKEIFLLLHELGGEWRFASEIEFTVCVTDPYVLQAYKSVFKK